MAQIGINSEIKYYNSGVHNYLDDTITPADSASDELGWVTQDGRLKLVGGRLAVGAEGLSGMITGEIFGFKTDGTSVHWRKSGANIEYFDGAAWQVTITGLTVNADYSFSNYSSLAGAFTFAVGADGIFKMNNASPQSYLAMYVENVNFKGLAMIDRGRMILWARQQDKTGLYGSWIDRQDSTVYTSVVNEAVATGDGSTKTFSGTLVNVGPQQNVFGLQFVSTGAPKTILSIALGQSPNVKVTGHGYSAGDKLYFGNIKDSVQGQGTAAWSGGLGQITVTGTSTHFDTDLLVGSMVAIGQYICKVISIGSGTSMVVNYDGSSGGPAVAFSGAYYIYSMKQLSNIITTVQNVVDADNFTIAVDTTNFQPYAPGGTVAKQNSSATDDFLGHINPTPPNVGITGTINYITGAYSITFATAPANGASIIVNYQWENSNARGITNFNHSAVRLAGEGFQFPQDQGGDAILNVLIGLDGSYYSAKKNSFYVLTIGDDDVTASNEVYRTQLGIQSWRGVLSMQLGIIFMNTANPEKPELTILQKNPIGGNIEPKVLFPQFKFGNYDYSDLCIETYDRYIVLACRQQGSGFNDRLLLCNLSSNTVDIEPYQARTLAKDAGNLYGGSPVALTIYNIFNGFDDDGDVIQNFWQSKNELFQLGGPGQARTKRFVPAVLKKHRRLRLRGLISAHQSYEVYCNYDDAGDQLIGTVLGTGSYVDYTDPQSIGGPLIGGAQVGGDDVVDAYPYFVELRIKKPPKFMKRKFKFIALGFGYVDICYQNDWGLQFYEDKIPARFRQKQNVSLDGTQTDLPTPEF